MSEFSNEITTKLGFENEPNLSEDELEKLLDVLEAHIYDLDKGTSAILTFLNHVWKDYATQVNLYWDIEEQTFAGEEEAYATYEYYQDYGYLDPPNKSFNAFRNAFFKDPDGWVDCRKITISNRSTWRDKPYVVDFLKGISRILDLEEVFTNTLNW